jgi:two-component system phosphate regulon sensor histidine kinase PhoR
MTVAFSVLAAGTLLLLGLYLESLVVRYTEANIEERLRAETHLAAQVLPPPPWSAGKDLDRRVRELDQVLSARVTLIDPAGKVLADSQADATTLENHAGRPERLQALGQGWGSAVRFSATQRFMNEYVALALPAGSSRPSMLRLAVPLTTALAASQELRRALLLTLAAALVVILLVSARIAQALSRPVQRLVRVARRVARGDLQARVEAPAEGELGELSAVFNSALARLETLVQSS